MSSIPYLPPANAAQTAYISSLIHVTPRMVAYDNAQVALSISSVLVDLIVLMLILNMRIASRFGIFVDDRLKGVFWPGAWMWMLLHCVTFLALLPISFWSGFELPHRYGLSTESLQLWLADFVKSWLVDLAYGAVIAGAALVLIRRYHRSWSLLMPAIMIPVVAAGIFAEPLVIDPLFNKFTPMPVSNPLYAPLHQLARKAGVRKVGIYVVDKGRQTKETNAYVTGMGSSSRIVIWDTLIAETTPKQVVAVTAHEMGHYVERHVVIGFAASVAGLFVLFPLLRRLTEAMLGRWGVRWGIESISETSALAALLLAFNLIGCLAMPLASCASRYIEHRADAFGLSLIRDRVTFASALVALSSDNLSNPYPSAWVALLMDHPPLGERIDFALHGQPRDIWPPLCRHL